ncbi:MAG: type II CRISPR RNA-guided endonuclease Cas9 [Acidimicrobiales bacterium]
MKYRLSLDLGTNSLGWCLLELGDVGNPAGIITAGVRIFGDGRNPKDGSSLAVMRRGPRQMRRRRDRYLGRRERLMAALIKHGLMPQSEAERKALEHLDPYELRARGVNAPISLFEFGRAIFHLNQRRGFKSNRKVDKGPDDDSGKIKSAIKLMRDKMGDSDAKTTGEYFYQLHKERKPVRARLHGEGAKASYDFYPDRGLTAKEFDLLWQTQQPFHPGALSETAKAEILDILLHQRPLRPVRPGKCTFEPHEERAPWALPVAQRKRILEELNKLRFGEFGRDMQPLTLEQRNILAAELGHRAKYSFDQMRKKLKLPTTVAFSDESEKRQELKGDETAVKLSKEQYFGQEWFGFIPEVQNEIVERLLNDDDETGLIAWLCDTYNLSEQTAQAIANVTLPEGHGSLGRTALGKIVPELEKEVVVYSEAMLRAGYHHSDFRDGEIFDALPYYGIPLERYVAFGSGEPTDADEKRYGKIANPTVHVGLNQVRKLVNAIIARHGHPEEVILEVARALKNSLKKRQDIEDEQKRNQDNNKKYREEMEKMGIADNGENRMRMRLWEELNRKDALDRRCPYSGEQISLNRLFTDEIEIDHILPFSKTLDNSAANRTVSLRRMNRIKGNRAPYNAFSSNPHPKIIWQDILDRAESLPDNKKWRFQPDAMQRFENEERDFLDRQLTDTQYLSRITKEYLSKVCDPNRVWVTPGRLTAMLRGRWGLNSILSDHNRKNRTDHRHHAIDAIVIGVTDRGLLNKISRAAASAEAQHMERLLADMPEPFPNFRDHVKQKVQAILVSHKPDHGRQGALHNDTAYGIAAGPNAKGVSEVVTRVPITSFKKMAELDLIRDESWRERIKAAVEGLPEKEMKQALQNLSDETGIRRIRILQPMTVIPIKDKNGRVYKAYKGDGNSCYEIFLTPKGKWDGEVISTFDANQKNFTARWHKEYPTAPLVMRLFKDDLVELDHDAQRRVMRVVQITQGKIILAEHHEGGNLRERDRSSAEDDPFKYLIKAPSALQKAGAKKAAVSILG